MLASLLTVKFSKEDIINRWTFYGIVNEDANAMKSRITAKEKGTFISPFSKTTSNSTCCFNFCHNAYADGVAFQGMTWVNGWQVLIALLHPCFCIDKETYRCPHCKFLVPLLLVFLLCFLLFPSFHIHDSWQTEHVWLEYVRKTKSFLFPLVPKLQGK